MNKESALQALKWELEHTKSSTLKDAILALHPELAESEDERIRKHIIDIIKDNAKSKCIPCDVEIAYLEKQKEPLTPEEKMKHPLYIEGFEAGKQVGAQYEAVFGKQKEQKPAEWSEEYREEDLQARFAFYTYKDEDGVLYLSNVFVEETSRNKGFGTKILQAAEKVAETIGAISIRLKVKQGSPANNWYRKHGYGYITFEDGYDWLEKTLEYLKPAKQEWSEEDEKMLKLCEDFMSEFYSTEAMQVKSWLKSLRLQPHWKPSEEQIRVFLKATPVNLMPEEFSIYNSFRNDIQKLM